MTANPHVKSAMDTVSDSSGLAGLAFLRLTAELTEKLLSTECNDIKTMKQELALLEQGGLYIRKRSTKFLFSKKNRQNGKETCINNDNELIYALARRSFLEERLRETEYRILQLRKLVDRITDADYDWKLRKKLSRFADSSLDLTQIIFTKEQREWINEPFTPNPFYRDNLTCATKGNVLMRSKSEVMIGNALEAIGVPYRYDDLVRIETEPSGRPSRRPFRDNYFADFKIPNLIGGITIHEHLGAFQMDNYSINALERLNDYHNFTIYELPGRPVRNEEITWSFEGDITNPQLLRKLIRHMLLPLVL